MTRIIICIMMLLANFKVLALDSEVTILVVYTPTTATNLRRMTDATDYANTVWNNLGITTPLTFANNGLPVALSSSLGGGNVDMATQISQAYSNSQISSLRDNFKADIVLIFSAGSTSKCGVTRGHNWNNGNSNFLPSTDQLDLRDKEVNYISIVNMECGTEPNTTAHELGHIFGADHYTEPGLYPDSLGFRRNVVKVSNSEPMIIQESSPMATPGLGSCEEDICVNTKYYSTSQYSAYGNSTHNNRRAIATTARSVANYYQGALVLKQPIALVGFVVNACTQSGATEHRIFWTEGGSNVPISHYELWAKQGSQYYYTYRWDVVGLAQSSAFVWGSTAYVRVKACYGNLCSELSDSYYAAADLCDYDSGIGTSGDGTGTNPILDPASDPNF